jgi:tetratricopeptide (TPR) repeat protein
MSEHELWNELGNLYFISGAYNQAIYAYHRSIQMDSSFGRPYSNLALAYVQQGKYEEAIELYRQSIELLADNKEKAISWNKLGNVHRYLKNYQKAVIAYQQADVLDPDSIEGREEPGQLLYASADTPSSNTAVTPGQVEAGPSEVQALVPPSLAIVDEFPAPEAAILPVTSANAAKFELEISTTPPASPFTIWEVGSPGQEPDPAPSAAEDLEVFAPGSENEFPAALPLNPRSEQPFSLSGSDSVEDLCEVDFESFADPETFSIQDLSTADTPPQPEDSNNLWIDEYSEQMESEAGLDVADLPALTFVVASVQDDDPIETQPEQRGDLDGSMSDYRDQESKEIEVEIARFRRVVQINGRNAFAWDTLGTLYKSANMYKDAILAYQEAISINCTKAFYYYHLGLAYAADGRDEDAITAFQRVIEIDPDYSLAHATLGGYYRKMGLEELAQKHLGKAMKNIFDSENEYNRACLEAICGNADQAIELLRVALMNKQTYVDWVLRDPDLDFIRQDSRFKQLISEFTR